MSGKGGRGSRDKGNRIEVELVHRHKDIGVHCERYPASGAPHFRNSSHDVDIYALGRDEAPLVAEVKGRKSGEGFVQLERWLSDFDALFLRRNNAEPMVVLPWRTWAQLLGKLRR
jgi:Holliday junction resolvase